MIASAIEQRRAPCVHRADVGVEQVVGIDRLAADLGVEVDAAGPEAAGLAGSRSSASASSGTFMANWSVSQPSR